MKLLSIAVPCYNSQDYMRNCVDSLLKGGELVEILIVNDGSKDDTAKIADEYAEKYPTIVRAIHQENGGHGEAVNTGIRNATGFYFKVVDSDDWVNEEAFEAILKKLQELIAGPQTLDMMISNFVYEKQGVKRKKIMRYRKYLPQNRIFTWDEVSNMPVGKYILMHSVIYRTELLRECGLELPKHTFYVDNLFVYQPLMSVKTMYYMDENFYRYFIGREDQSVHEDVMIRRIDQQLLVNRLMVDTIAGKKISNKHLRQYMLRYLDIITTVSSVMLIRSGTEENLNKKKDLWKYIKNADINIYSKLRLGILGRAVNLPGAGGVSLIAGHCASFFSTLGSAQIGDLIKIETTYGTYTYKIAEAVVKKATDPTAYDPTKTDNSIVLYTCYPFNTIISVDERYFVYADFVSGPILIKE